MKDGQCFTGARLNVSVFVSNTMGTEVPRTWSTVKQNVNAISQSFV